MFAGSEPRGQQHNILYSDDDNDPSTPKHNLEKSLDEENGSKIIDHLTT